MSDIASDEAQTLTDEAILERFTRTKNQPTGSQTLGFRLVAVSQARKEAVSYTHLTLPTIYSV